MFGEPDHEPVEALNVLPEDTVPEIEGAICEAGAVIGGTPLSAKSTGIPEALGSPSALEALEKKYARSQMPSVQSACSHVKAAQPQPWDWSKAIEFAMNMPFDGLGHPNSVSTTGCVSDNGTQLSSTCEGS